MKSGIKIVLLCSALALALAGCAPANRALNKSFSSLNLEAGKTVDEGNFGEPTQSNIQVQSAYRSQGGLIANLSRRFERDVPTMVNFDFNKSTLDARSRAILSKQARWIKQFPEIKFRVYGHTDLVGTKAANKRLGLRRARTVVRYLISHGVNGDRLQAMVSYGETQPLVVTQGRERKNRRTVTEVTGFARTYEGSGLDGKYANLLYRKYVKSELSVAAAKAQ